MTLQKSSRNQAIMRVHVSLGKVAMTVRLQPAVAGGNHNQRFLLWNAPVRRTVTFSKLGKIKIITFNNVTQF